MHSKISNLWLSFRKFSTVFDAIGQYCVIKQIVDKIIYKIGGICHLDGICLEPFIYKLQFLKNQLDYWVFMFLIKRLDSR